MFLRLLQQQPQELSRCQSVAIVVGDQATAERQSVADRVAMVDLQCNIQRLTSCAPGLFGLTLQPQDARQNCQRRHTLVVLHPKAVGKTVAVPAVGHPLDHPFGIHPRLPLISAEVQCQAAQAIRAEGQHSVVV